MKQRNSGVDERSPQLNDRERQICARCFRTRYEHERGLIPDHPFEEVKLHERTREFRLG